MYSCRGTDLILSGEETPPPYTHLLGLDPTLVFFRKRSLLTLHKSLTAGAGPLYTVSQKKCKNLFFVRTLSNFDRSLKIFGKKIAKRTSFSEMYSFFTSPNLCQRTTVLNADVPNCDITL